MEKTLRNYDLVFHEELGTCSDQLLDFVIDPSIKPKFCAARLVPYVLRDEVEEELARVQKEGIIESVAQSQWALIIVFVCKQRRQCACLWCLDYCVCL